MEALVSELSGSLSVGTEQEESDTGPARDAEPDAAADSCSGGDHRQAQYKNVARVGDSQHARRRDLLQRQKRSVCTARAAPEPDTATPELLAFTLHFNALFVITGTDLQKIAMYRLAFS